jgi:hypothetical protein
MQAAMRREKRKMKRLVKKEVKKQKKEAGEEVPHRPRPRPAATAAAKTPQRVCIDLDFDKYHKENDIKKLMKQVRAAHTAPPPPPRDKWLVLQPVFTASTSRYALLFCCLRTP